MKGKAKELVDRFRLHAKLRSSGFLVANEDHTFYHAKQCALICVDELIKEVYEYQCCEWTSGIDWQEVKKEIETG